MLVLNPCSTWGCRYLALKLPCPRRARSAHMVADPRERVCMLARLDL